MDITQLHKLQGQVHQGVLALIWVADEPLTFKTPWIYELDYFFQGLLLQAIKMKSTDDEKLFIKSHSFDGPFYFLAATGPQAWKKIEEMLPLLDRSSSKKTLLIQTSQKPQLKSKEFEQEMLSLI